MAQAKKARKRKLKKGRGAKLKELVQRALAKAAPAPPTPPLVMPAPRAPPAIAYVAELEEKKEEKEKAAELLEEKVVEEPHKVAAPEAEAAGVEYRPLPAELKELKESLYKVATPESYERIRELETRAARGTLAPRDVERIERYGQLFDRLKEIRPEYIESKAARELFEREKLMLEHIEAYRAERPWEEERRRVEKREEKEKKRLEY